MVDNEQHNLTIREWAEEDRPREKLITKGRSVLTDAELIAILIRSGNDELSAVDLAKLILSSAGNDLTELAKFSVEELKKFRGIGEAKALAIISALEIGRRRRETEPQKKDRLITSKDTYDLMRPHLLDLKYEQFWVILLNRSNIVLKKIPISIGGVAGTVADPKLIFKTALENLASAIILVHNHPSGNVKPSDADIVLTRKIRDAGKLLDIPVLDHVIFTDLNYYSFSDEGRLL